MNNIRNVENTLELQTNGGTLTVKQTFEILYLDTHWFNKDAITNIISLADLSKKYRVTMDTTKEKSMTVHLNEQQVKLSQMS